MLIRSSPLWRQVVKEPLKYPDDLVDVDLAFHDRFNNLLKYELVLLITWLQHDLGSAQHSGRSWPEL